MANSGIYEDDYLTDPGSDEDLDVDSDFDESPADGYFEQRPHPQDTFVENSSITAAADAKAREAAEVRASSSAAAPPSQISSVASSPRSVAWTDVETPFAVNTDAPPDYESATANRSARTTLPPPSRDSNQTGHQETPQSAHSYGSMPFTEHGHESGIGPGHFSPTNNNNNNNNNIDNIQWPFGNANNPFNAPGFPFGPNGFPGLFAVGNRTTNMPTHHPPSQSMSDPPLQQNVAVDEETGLLSQRPRSPSKRKLSLWRRCCKPISTCNAVLVIAIIILIVLIAGNSDDRDTSGGNDDGDGDNVKKPVSPPLSPSPSPVPSPLPSIPPSHGQSCDFDDYSEPLVLDFVNLQNFSFVELMESSNYLTGGIIGKIRIKPAASGQDADLQLSISYATTRPWLVESSNYFMTDDRFVLQLPKLKHIDAVATSRPCLGVYVDMVIKQGVRLDNWELASGNLDVVVEDGLFNHNAGQEELSAFGVNKYSIFNTIRGDIQVSYWSSRETEIDTVSGSIKGTLALLDLLSVKTHSGSIRINVNPKDADPNNVKPADFVAITSSGSVHVDFPTVDPLPSRDYQTRIETQSGSIGGGYILGALTTFSTQSGSVKPSLKPVFSSTAPSKLHVDTKSASQTVNIMSPRQYPGDFAKLHMDHKYTSISGSLHLAYPQEWEGYIEGETVSGGIHVKGKDVQILKQGRIGHVFEHIVARKGVEGNGKIGFKTTSGSVNLQVGDL